jgi:hypothetical protein
MGIINREITQSWRAGKKPSVAGDPTRDPIAGNTIFAQFQPS